MPGLSQVQWRFNTIQSPSPSDAQLDIEDTLTRLGWTVQGVPGASDRSQPDVAVATSRGLFGLGRRRGVRSGGWLRGVPTLTIPEPPPEGWRLDLLEFLLKYDPAAGNAPSTHVVGLKPQHADGKVADTAEQIELRLTSVIGQDVGPGVVKRWIASPGDTVAAGETIVELTIAGVNTELSAPISGEVSQLLTDEGKSVQVGDALVLLDQETLPTPVGEEPRSDDGNLISSMAESPNDQRVPIDLAEQAPSNPAADAAPPAAGGSALPSVFVSYSRKDRSYVEQLVAYLAGHGVSVWIDRSDIDYGSRWRTSIRTALEMCAAVVVIMTPEAESSEWVEREIAYAELLDKPIVPLLLRGTIMFSLAHLQYEDVRAVDMPGDEWVRQLVRQVRADG